MLNDKFVQRVRERQKSIVAQVMRHDGVPDWATYRALVSEYSGLDQALTFADQADREDSESLDPVDPDGKFQ